MRTTLGGCVDRQACIDDGHLAVLADRDSYRQSLRPGPGRVRCRACGTYRPEAPLEQLAQLLGLQILAVRRAVPRIDPVSNEETTGWLLTIRDGDITATVELRSDRAIKRGTRLGSWRLAHTGRRDLPRLTVRQRKRALDLMATCADLGGGPDR